jgi:hypothetical protein
MKEDPVKKRSKERKLCRRQIEKQLSGKNKWWRRWDKWSEHSAALGLYILWSPWILGVLLMALWSQQLDHFICIFSVSIISCFKNFDPVTVTPLITHHLSWERGWHCSSWSLAHGAANSWISARRNYEIVETVLALNWKACFTSVEFLGWCWDHLTCSPIFLCTDKRQLCCSCAHVMRHSELHILPALLSLSHPTAASLWVCVLGALLLCRLKITMQQQFQHHKASNV